jgi:hypothetical protein
MGRVPRTPRRNLGIPILGGVLTTAVVVSGVLFWVPMSSEQPSQAQTGSTTIGVQQYNFETVIVGNLPSIFSYRGVTFDFSIGGENCFQNTGGGTICGNVIEPNGDSFSFSISLSPPTYGPGPWATWVTPSHREAVEIEGDNLGSTANDLTHLLVAA